MAGPGTTNKTVIDANNINKSIIDPNLASNIVDADGATKDSKILDYKNGLWPIIKHYYDNDQLDFSNKRSSLNDANKQAEFDKVFYSAVGNPTTDEAVEKIEAALENFIGYNTDPTTFLASSAPDAINTLVSGIFEAEVNKNIDSGIDEFFGGGDYLDIEELIEEIDNETPGATKSALDGLGRADDQSDLIAKIQPLELKQCALMSIIFDSTIVPKIYSCGYQTAHTYDNHPYKKRIYIVEPDANMNASEVNNYFYGDGKQRDFYRDTGTMDAKFFKDLYFVYFDSTDNIMKEVKLSKSTADGDGKTSKKLSDINQKLYNHKAGVSILTSADIQNLKASKRKILAEANVAKESTQKDSEINNQFALDKIEIQYNGTNPSTARNDVKVSISFILESFNSLNVDISETINAAGRPPKTALQLKDLVIAALGDDGSAGSMSALRNIYSPSQNRIRLKYKPAAQTTQTTYDQPASVLDLALVDHSLSRNADDGTVSFTINYRGYMQSMLQMPFSNVLLTDSIITDRQTRQANLNDLIGKNCSAATLREILRVERSTSELEVRNNFGALMTKMLANGSVFKYTWPNTDLVSIFNNVVQAGGKKKIKIGKARKPDVDEEELLKKASEEGVSQDEGGDDSINESSSWWSPDFWTNRDHGDFIYFGDIVYAVTDILYDANDTMRAEIKDKLKFIFMPIQLPNPKSNNGFTTLNPAWIPVDTFFFSQWWHETIVKKELSFYPMASFIRDLAERLIGNLLYEICVANLLPDENPPILRTSYFSSDETFDSRRDKKNIPVNYSISNLQKPFFKFNYTSTTTNTGGTGGTSTTTASELKSENFIVLYNLLPPFKREINNKKNNQKLYDSEFVPTLIYGINSKDYTSHVDSVSFSKTTTQGLREARYFNNSFGSMALMNNVYDLSFQINNNNPTTYFYPGTLLNFVLTDFGRYRYKSNGVINFAKVGKSLIEDKNSKKVPEWTFTQNDPHNSATTAHKLGFGGYYIVKSVTQTLGASDASHDLSVECKFLATESDSLVKDSASGEVMDAINADKNDCRVVYDSAVKANQSAVDAYNATVDDEKKRTGQFQTSTAPTTSATNSTTTTPTTSATNSTTTTPTTSATNSTTTTPAVPVVPGSNTSTSISQTDFLDQFADTYLKVPIAIGQGAPPDLPELKGTRDDNEEFSPGTYYYKSTLQNGEKYIVVTIKQSAAGKSAGLESDDYAISIKDSLPADQNSSGDFSYPNIALGN